MFKAGLLILAAALLTLCTEQSLEAAKKESGYNLFLLPDSAAALGRGGTGIATGGVDLFDINPASIASYDGMAFSFQYGTFSQGFLNPSAALALPTSYGIFGASVRYFSTPAEKAGDFEKASMATLGGSKEFSENLSFGISLRLFQGTLAGSTLQYKGLGMGALYHVPWEKSFAKGFGLFNPTFGLTGQYGSYQEKEDDTANFNQGTFGFHLGFYRSRLWSVGWYQEISYLQGYGECPVKTGIESRYGSYLLFRAGTILPQSYQYGDLTLGAGFRLQTEHADMTVDYALVHYSGSQFIHRAGITIKHNRLDTEPPDTEVTPDLKFFSPNYDGIQDFVFFRLNVSDASRIKGWRFQVLNDKNRVVREFRSSQRDIETDLTPMRFVMRLWQKREYLALPERLLWDGCDVHGNVVQDGRYRFSFTAWDVRDNIALLKEGHVYVNNTPPSAEIHSDQKYLTPTGALNALKIHHKIIRPSDGEWQAGFINEENKTVRSYSWPSSAIPDSLSWDGRDDDGKPCPPGSYSYFLTTRDRSGNIIRKVIKDLWITVPDNYIGLNLPDESFSFRSGKPMKIQVEAPAAKSIFRWNLIIEDRKNNTLRLLKGDALNQDISWDGKDHEGQYLEDGVYHLSLFAVDRKGILRKSLRRSVIIDNTPPNLSLDYSPDLFSPDRDGKNDILTIYPRIQDNNGIKEWLLNIYSPSGEVFKTFRGYSSATDRIKWNGKGVRELTVLSAAEYTMDLIAVDRAGNASRSRKISFHTGILVAPSSRGFTIRVSTLDFTGVNTIESKKGRRSLDMLIDTIRQYKNHEIIIEGHTDDVGEEENNLKISEARARYVMEELIKSGIPKRRMSFRGMGETRPVIPDTRTESRIRNNRIEIILTETSLED